MKWNARPPWIYFRCPRFLFSAWQENRQNSKNVDRKNMESVPLLCKKHSYLSCCRGKREEEEWESGGLSHSLIQLCIAPHWRALVLTPQWCQQPFLTHAGSSDSHEARGDGGKNKQLGSDFSPDLPFQPECPFFSPSCSSSLFPLWLAVLLFPLNNTHPSSFCFLTMRGSTVSPIVCWEALQPVSPADSGLPNCVSVFFLAQI